MASCPANVTIISGPPGVAKSYLALSMLLHAGDKGVRWKLLPLEDDSRTWQQKALAVRIGSWRMMAQPEFDTEEEREAVANWKLERLAENEKFAGILPLRIAENPRMPIDDGTGHFYVPPVDYHGVLDFVERESEKTKLICIDPVSQIEFDPDGRNYRGQAEFVRLLAAKVPASGVHVILVAHTAKQQYRGTQDHVDSVQGSSLFGRLAHNIITINRHDPAIEDEVYSAVYPKVVHRLTITVSKSRSGTSGDRIAYDLDREGPIFREHGLIKLPDQKRYR